LILTIVMSLSAIPVFAQQPPDPPVIDRAAFRESLARVRSHEVPAAWSAPRGAHAATTRRAEMGTGWSVLWTAVAGTGGFFAGGALGASIDDDCNGCDDPGLKGALIGAPIGAATAAIVTWIVSGK
jgi:hypothetical protein